MLRSNRCYYVEGALAMCGEANPLPGKIFRITGEAKKKLFPSPPPLSKYSSVKVILI